MSALAERTAYAVHPLADLMPAMRDSEYQELREDITANGLREPITLYESKVLDGRHRYRACQDAGVWPTFQNYEGDSPAAYVLSLNVKRRQLTQSQKAMLATDFKVALAEEAKRRQGTRTDLATSEPNGSEVRFERSAKQAARLVGVGHGSVIRADKVKTEDSALADKVRQGEMTVTAAYAKVTEPDSKPTLNGRAKASAFNTETEGGRARCRTAKERIERAVGTCNGIARGFGELNPVAACQVASPEEITGWLDATKEAAAAIRRLQKQLKEFA